ncbi:protoporphyrinogen oxidase HemJ [Azospirillum melinis]|uniref:protoporphyrinogen oxidase HemJ n=1 Tax=Azospirillum melinis TaxID=328839 RepID=UPI003757F666
MLYEWIKALHVISIIAWMAGLLYLPRLFVYHCQVAAGSEASETFKVMERRLLRAIMNPAMIAAYVFGIAMIVLTPEWMKQGWLHAKLLFVLLLTASHMMMARWRRDFAEDRNTRPPRFYRIANEVPTLLMIGIVIFVIVKPF